MRPDSELVASRRSLGPVSEVTGASALCSGDDTPSSVIIKETLTLPEAEVEGAIFGAGDGCERQIFIG